MDVFPFLRDNYQLKPENNGAIAKQVHGWADEKREIKRQALEKAKLEMYRNYAPDPAVLWEMHKWVITLMQASIQNELKKCLSIWPDGKVNGIKKTADISTLERLWKMVKSEKQEPTEVYDDGGGKLTEEDSKFIALLKANL